MVDIILLKILYEFYIIFFSAHKKHKKQKNNYIPYMKARFDIMLFN